MNRYDDLTPKQKAFFKNNGYRWMKALYEERDGEWVKVRDGFFYKAFETKKARDAEAKRFATKLVKKNEKPAEKRSVKKSEAKKQTAKKQTAKKPDLSKYTKAQLIEMLMALNA